MSEYEAKLLLPAVVEKSGHNQVRAGGHFSPHSSSPLPHFSHYPAPVDKSKRSILSTVRSTPLLFHTQDKVRLENRELLCRVISSLHTFITIVTHNFPTPLQDKIRLENRELLRRASAVYGPAKVVLYIKVWGRGGEGEGEEEV